MSQLTKQQLKGENQTQFPNNNVGAITPSHLRAFNVDMIDSTVNQTDFTNFSGSVASEFANLTASVDPSITGSSLITASFDNGTRNLTFTKGDASTFAVNIPDVSGSTLNTGSFATTGSNTFIGTEIISGALFVFDSGSGTRAEIMNGAISRFPQLYATQLVPQNISSDNGINISFDLPAGGFTNGGTFKVNAISGSQFTGSVSIQGDVNITGSLTASLQQGYVWVGDASGRTATVATSSFGGGGTTYTNPSLNPYSGSLVLVANTFTSSSFAHISASANGQVNLVFKNNNNTGTTILSGSNNIFTNPGAPSAGFVRYIGGSDNLIQNANAVPQITSSAQFSPAFNSNIINSNNTNFFMRAPVSASGAWTIRNNYLGGATVNVGTFGIPNPGINVFNFTNNVVAGGSVTFTAPINLANNTGFSNNYINGTLTLNLNSSSVAMAFCNVNDSSFIINNNAYDSSTGGGAGTGSLSLNRLNIGGSGNTITARNAGTMSSYSDNVIFGAGNSIAIDLSQTNNAFNGTQIMGKNLIVTASGAFPDSNGQFVGSMFVGRNNAVDGNKALTAQTIFAVGTGTNPTTGRKTGLLIDSGSNTFVEGTLNVSGSTTMTGSLLISSSATYDLIITGAARVVSQNGLQINTIRGNTFNIDTTQDASVNAENYIYASTASVASVYVGVYDSNANTDVELKLSADSNGISFNDWDNVDGAYESWLTLDANVGNNPIPAFTRGLNVINGTSINLAQNSQSSGSQYSQVSIFADTATNPADVYAGFQVLDASNSNAGLLQMAANSYTPQYGGQTVGWIGGGGNNPAGNTTAIIFRTGSALMEVFKPTTFAYDISLTGSLYIQSGSTLPVSTGSAILTWDATTGQVKQAGFSTIISASVSAAEFWSTTTQSGSAGVSGSLSFNNSGSFYNVSVVNGTQLKVANAGVYNIQFSAQLETSAGADTVYVWFKKNGNNISDSASKAVLANNTAQIMTVNILDEAAANDYYEIAYQNVNGHATVLAEAASGNIPAIPSVIATVIQVR